MKKMTKLLCLTTAVALLVTGCGCDKGEGATKNGLDAETSNEMNTDNSNGTDFLVWDKITEGSAIAFGSYEQDNDINNGKEAIEWIVLDKKDGKALVVSKYLLDCKPYHDEYTAVTWETCTLRGWLNEEFINTAFTESERELIPTVTVEAHENPDYDVETGRATEDKVFLLSIAEVNEYFESDSERVSYPTDYAKANGVYTYENACWWWLRTIGHDQEFVASVHFEGLVETSASPVDFDRSGVRPAMWIELTD